MKLQIVVPAEGATPFLDFFDALDEKQRQKLLSLFALLLQSPAAVMREPYVKHFSIERYGIFKLANRQIWGKSYFTSVHATMSPNTTFTIAAINDEVMLVIKAFLTFSFIISATKSPGDIFSEYTSTDANGMRTMTESIVTTIPSERW